MEAALGIRSKVEIFAPFLNNMSMASNAGEDLKSLVSGLKVKPRIETLLFFNVPKMEIFVYSAKL